MFENVQDSICEGESYLFNGNVLTFSGRYNDTLKSRELCDSIVILDLRFVENKETQVQAKICPSEVFTYDRYSFSEPGQYILAIPHETGCEDVIHIDLQHYNMYIPNAFTPNGDGNNDFFGVYGREDILMVEALLIYDRWGGLVFEEMDRQLSISSEFWDGTINGGEAPSAVYVYLLQLQMRDGKKKTIKGDFTLLR